MLSKSPAITPIAASELDLSDVDDSQPNIIQEKQVKENQKEAQKIKFKTIELKNHDEDDWILQEEPMERDELKFGF